METNYRHRVLILGGTGPLGSIVRNTLIQSGYDVVVTGQAPKEAYQQIINCAYISWDCLSDNSLSIIDVVKPNTILYLSAVSNIQRCQSDLELAWRVNCFALLRLVEKLPEKIRLIFASTDRVFDSFQGRFIVAPHLQPRTVYGRSKLTAEINLQSCRSNYVIIRFGKLLDCRALLSNPPNIIYDNLYVFPVSAIYIRKTICMLMKSTEERVIKYLMPRANISYASLYKRLSDLNPSAALPKYQIASLNEKDPLQNFYQTDIPSEGRYTVDRFLSDEGVVDGVLFA